MISSVRDAWRRLRATKPPQEEPDCSHEVLTSIRWLHQEHVKDLRTLGYSPKEAFWLDFACLPFLPWSGTAHSGIRLSTVLSVYIDLYQTTIGPLEPADADAFVTLLRQRYHSVRRTIATSDGLRRDGPRVEGGGWADSGQQKWALAGLIVLWTARQWQEHPSAFPCRLVED